MPRTIRRSQGTKIRSGYRSEFSIRDNLIGLAIGTHGANIQRARKVEGIISIEMRQNKFAVYGETQEAVTKARGMLEFAQDTHQVPKELAPQIIGTNSRKINDIRDDSGLVRLTIKRDKQQKPSRKEVQVCFVLVGTMESIAGAHMLLDSHLSQLKRRSGYMEEFTVREPMIGLALGKHGANIQRARDVEGIISIELNGNTFKIYGENPEIVKNARDMLEFAEETFHLPPQLVENNGRTIHDIQSKSGLVTVKVKGDNNPEESGNQEGTPFIFVGTVKSIEKARLLLDTRLSELRSATKRSGYMEVFSVRQDLMELAKGTNGAHIRQALKVGGIKCIEQKENTFEISGETQSAVKEARKLLEFTEHTFKVSGEFVAKLTESEGRILHDIQVKSGLVTLEMNRDNYEQASEGTCYPTMATDIDGQTSFTMVGTLESVANAQQLLDYQIRRFKTEQLRQARLKQEAESRFRHEWQEERTQLYTRLTELADDLDDFHRNSSKVVVGGGFAEVGGQLLEWFGAITGKEGVRNAGNLLKHAGSIAVHVTQKLKEGEDVSAIEETRKLLHSHENTHNDLKRKVSDVNLPSFDYHAEMSYSMFETKKMPSRNIDTITKEDRVMFLLSSLGEALRIDVPLFYESWETMKGRNVPDIVYRLRNLTDELESMQNQLTARLEKFFNKEGF